MLTTVSRLCALCVAALLPLSAAVNCPGHGDRTTMLVSTAWLADHLHDANLVLISVGAKAEFDRQHIAGARYIDLAMISAKDSALTLELPAMPELRETFRALGVSNDSRIVLYSILPTPQSATRVFLTLDAMGLGRNVSLLDGGLPQWLSEKRPVTTEIAVVKAGAVEPCAQPDIITDAAYVNANRLAAGVRIVDARLNSFYTGEQIPQNQRPGHVPGAANVPFASLVDSLGKLKPAEELSSIFAAAGIKSGDRVVSYCHIGQQATLVYFAARYLGFDARLYDGSWQDWSRRTDLPVITGNQPGNK